MWPCVELRTEQMLLPPSGILICWMGKEAGSQTGVISCTRMRTSPAFSATPLATTRFSWYGRCSLSVQTLSIPVFPYAQQSLFFLILLEVMFAMILVFHWSCGTTQRHVGTAFGIGIFSKPDKGISPAHYFECIKVAAILGFCRLLFSVRKVTHLPKVHSEWWRRFSPPWLSDAFSCPML